MKVECTITIFVFEKGNVKLKESKLADLKHDPDENYVDIEEAAQDIYMKIHKGLTKKVSYSDC